ncbi:MAG: hypothetical protein CMA62_02595 [Euryarchaeota archaeon]|nr:hypothetical protein [Euryarchaeota archaeon]DAC46360.1 MAG TPA: hypothetical protein D7H82_04125 [Candidatus Poseidoniales archaeon]HII34065.1 hypothetical protein [Candidatus Thalassarchaeaceae archaeon]|tara:strand:+ start:9013 stop:9777 length:765 start_codon:yes stop_codon:yes gene_type:complete
MSNRSPAISLALFLAPTLCIVAVRFGIPALEEVISNDFVLEASLHITAIAIGFFMLSRYARVEDHEYHRSNAIRRLSKTYRSEDRGLWEEKSDKALQRLESKVNTPSSKVRRNVSTRMSGRVGSLNTEMNEAEVDDDYEAEVHVSGMQTIVDDEAVGSPQENRSRISISKFINSSLDRSAEKRLQKIKEREKKATLKAQKKSEKNKSRSKDPNSPWESTGSSSTVKSVVSCNQCGTINNSGSQYCTSCGNYLIQ